MSRGNVNFESVFEKIARIMARSYGIEVVIEGNTAWTDGKKIVLPSLEDVSEELRADLNGFLDHEVAHCKYTNFEAGKRWINRFHRELSNAIEDSRIEKLLPQEYPGTALSLERMNQKWQAKLDEKRPQLPWPIRFLLTLRDIYDGKPIVKDDQIEPLVAAVLPQAKALRGCVNTDEVVDQTAEIIRLVNLAREEMYKGNPPADEGNFDELDEMRGGETPLELDPDRESKEGKEAQGIEQYDPATQKKEQKQQSEAEGENEEGEQDGEGEGEGAGEESEESETKGEGKGKGKNEKASMSAEQEGEEEGAGDSKGEKSEKHSDSKNSEKEAEPKSDKESGAERKDAGDTTVDKLETRKNYAEWKESSTEKQMLNDSVEGESEFDKHEFNTESYMETQFEKAISKEPKVQNLHGMYRGKGGTINSKLVSIPYTRQYDKVTDYSGRGDGSAYAERKRAIMKYVRPITQQLERVLLVKENKKMIGERERGMLNNRTLANMIVDKNYRTPFRQFTKTDTRDVAVQLVLDCSGSMGGNKIEVARQTGLAFGEALKNIGVACEIVGFNTNDNRSMYGGARNLGAGDVARFNRFGTALNHMIFKSFDSNSLNGICRAESGGCNADGESITWAAKRLADRREKRKIMIVLSDGQPSYGGANHEVLAGDLKRVINLMPKAGIEAIGIGICTDDPKLFYKDYLVVNDVSKLATTVITKLAKLLEEGYK